MKTMKPFLATHRRSLLGALLLSSFSVLGGCASSSAARPTPGLAFGDTAHGADNFYTSDKVTVQKVVFKNQYKMKTVGNMFVPKSLNRNAKVPALVVGHPMGAVKEQSANLYATKMAEQGFITLALDLSFWGESDGQPRSAVAPDVYAEDFSAAVDFLRAQPFEERKKNLDAAALQRDVEFAGSEATYTSGTAEALSDEAYRLAGHPKELVVVPGAGHVDLYDRVNLIPFDTLTTFFRTNLQSSVATPKH